METYLYVGTYTNDNEAGDAPTGSGGIYGFRFCGRSGALQLRGITHSLNPSYLATDPNGNRLYAAGERMGSDTLSAFSIDALTGVLALAKIADLRGDWACHLSVCAKTHLAAIAHYWSGSLTTVRLDANGQPIEIACDLRHHGPVGSEDISRVHSAVFSPDGRFLYAADLGLRRLYCYQVDPQSGWLVPNPYKPYLSMPEGEAPRHFAFHPDGCRAYLVTESDSHVFALELEASTGRLNIVQRLSTLPVGFEGKNMASDIRVSPDGRFVYAANRGRNSIARFRVVERGLEYDGEDSCEGNWPRSFCMSQTGEWMAIANQLSEEVVIRRVDLVSGRLGEVTARERVPGAACPIFCQVER